MQSICFKKSRKTKVISQTNSYSLGRLDWKECICPEVSQLSKAIWKENLSVGGTSLLSGQGGKASASDTVTIFVPITTMISQHTYLAILITLLACNVSHTQNGEKSSRRTKWLLLWVTSCQSCCWIDNCALWFLKKLNMLSHVDGKPLSEVSRSIGRPCQQSKEWYLALPLYNIKS